MRKFLLVSLLGFAVAVGHAQGQERTITGKVSASEDGGALPGVNVVYKGSAIGTVSDTEGNYTLTVPGDGTLVFSFIGLVSQEIQIGTRSVIDVTMAPDATQLGEVVVTAVGIQREKKALGYSVEQVDGNKVQQVSEPDPLRALSGKIPGVNIVGSSGAPGSSTRITIRGNSSLLNNNQPLFVVDGIPYSNDMNGTNLGLTGGGAFSSRIADLDPNNIASMTVLKGASAAALYGTRAANGVIVITTKSGSAGASRKGLEVSYSATVGVETIANLPSFQNVYGTGKTFTYGAANGSWGAPFIGTRPYADVDSIPHWYAGRPGMEAYNGKNVVYKAYPNNVKDFFNTGQIVENSVNVNGGNEKSSISVTLSQLQQKGFVPETEFLRHNISVGGRTILVNGLTVTGSVAVTRSKQNGVISGVGDATSGDPSAFARTLYLGRNWDLQGQAYQNPLDFGSEFFVSRGNANNPYWSVKNSGIRSQVDRYVASIGAIYDFNQYLSLSYKLGINAYNQRQMEFQRPNGAGSTLGTLSEMNISSDEINSDLILSFTRDLSANFNLRAIAGWNINQRTSRSQAVQGTGYVVFDIDDLDNMNSLAPIPKNSLASGIGDYTRRRLMGAYVDVSLGYKDWAFLTLTGRNDWSSTLPVANRSFFYPAITGSVILNEALGMTSSVVNQIKLRGGYAEVGNDTSPYLLNNVYLINDYISVGGGTAQKPFTPRGGSPVPGATLSDVATDPKLKPERTSEVETGVDVSLWNDRAMLSVTYYNKTSKDQIAQATTPEETGFAAILTNFGSVSNKGIEVSLGLTPVQLSNSFRWNIVGAFTRNRNVVKSLRPGVDEIQYGSSFAGSVITVHRPGLQYGQLLGTADVRDDNGNLLIDPSTGLMIRGPERVIIGNPNPDYILGITNTFSFKGVTLSALFDLRMGGQMFSNTTNSILGRGVLAFQANRERNNVITGVYGNPQTLKPYLDDNGNTIANQTMVETNDLYFGESFAVNAADEWSVFDATTYRLREASLMYALPKGLLSKTPFGAVSIGFTGRNLWYYSPGFPRDLNYDPETNQFGATNQQGIEYSTTPSARRYSVNLRVTF